MMCKLHCLPLVLALFLGLIGACGKEWGIDEPKIPPQTEGEVSPPADSLTPPLPVDPSILPTPLTAANLRIDCEITTDGPILTRFFVQHGGTPNLYRDGKKISSGDYLSEVELLEKEFKVSFGHYGKRMTLDEHMWLPNGFDKKVNVTVTLSTFINDKLIERENKVYCLNNSISSDAVTGYRTYVDIKSQLGEAKQDEKPIETPREIVEEDLRIDYEIITDAPLNLICGAQAMAKKVSIYRDESGVQSLFDRYKVPEVEVIQGRYTTSFSLRGSMLQTQILASLPLQVNRAKVLVNSNIFKNDKLTNTISNEYNLHGLHWDNQFPFTLGYDNSTVRISDLITTYEP